MTTFLSLMYLIGFLSLTYMIYRYARYSPWRSQPIGRAFMMMKSALWAMLFFALLRRVIPHVPGLRDIQVLLVVYAISAIVYQTVVVVKLQGGVRRRAASQVLADTDRRA